jgi:hypothetical protein
LNRPELEQGFLRAKDGEPAFGEPWHAETLAIADLLVKRGVVSAARWAQTLGAEITALKAAPDDREGLTTAPCSPRSSGCLRKTAPSPARNSMSARSNGNAPICARRTGTGRACRRHEAGLAACDGGLESLDRRCERSEAIHGSSGAVRPPDPCVPLAHARVVAPTIFIESMHYPPTKRQPPASRSSTVARRPNGSGVTPRIQSSIRSTSTSTKIAFARSVSPGK